MDPNGPSVSSWVQDESATARERSIFKAPGTGKWGMDRMDIFVDMLHRGKDIVSFKYIYIDD